MTTKRDCVHFMMTGNANSLSPTDFCRFIKEMLPGYEIFARKSPGNYYLIIFNVSKEDETYITLKLNVDIEQYRANEHMLKERRWWKIV